MHPDDFHKLVEPGHISLSRVTEKTDGSAHLMGYDKDGFYTQYSGSGKEKMRSKNDFVSRATRRAKETGKPLDLSAARTFGDAHEKLARNPKLQSYLKQKAVEHGGETKLRGELFYKPNARPASEHPNPNERHPDHVFFVGTSYHPKHLGHTGAFVVHTGLEDNQGHDVHHIVNHLSDDHMSFHHDVTGIPKARVDVSSERDKFKSVNRSLLSARTTKSNKEAKAKETSKLDAIRQAVASKVQSHFENTKSKWGQGTPEGHVVHPNDDRPDQPRFKVTSSAFKSFKANKTAQDELKKRLKK